MKRTVLTKRIYKYDYDKLRKQVLRRDKYTCQMCKQKRIRKNQKFQVHHILTYGCFSSVREEITNLITLCIACHVSIKNKEHHYIKYFMDILTRYYDKPKTKKPP